MKISGQRKGSNAIGGTIVLKIPCYLTVDGTVTVITAVIVAVVVLVIVIAA